MRDGEVDDITARSDQYLYIESDTSATLGIILKSDGTKAQFPAFEIFKIEGSTITAPLGDSFGRDPYTYTITGNTLTVNDGSHTVEFVHVTSPTGEEIKSWPVML